jgi:succinate-semialdehyde dehydrogenase/glutarate-semialdehyde dehydrogenase
MGNDDVELAANNSMDAWKTWKNTTAKERSKILTKMATLMSEYQEDLAKIITLENGKPLSEAKGEVMYAQSFLEFYAEEAKRVYGDVLPSPTKDRMSVVLKQPVGPVALITPWNFPSAMITRKVIIPDHPIYLHFINNYLIYYYLERWDQLLLLDVQ